MKCPNCGNEVDTSICVACPNCRTKMPNAYSYPSEIGMQDSYGNRMTVGGSLDKPRKKVNRKVVVALTVVAMILAAIIIGINIYDSNQPRTYEESIILARQDAKEVVEQRFFKYRDRNTWYANECIADNGDNKFIIFCDVTGDSIASGYSRIQIYVGIELKKNDRDYTYWTIYGTRDNSPFIIQQLKEKMGW